MAVPYLYEANNANFFYFGKPHHYASCCGGHYRPHFNNAQLLLLPHSITAITTISTMDIIASVMIG